MKSNDLEMELRALVFDHRTVSKKKCFFFLNLLFILHFILLVLEGDWLNDVNVSQVEYSSNFSQLSYCCWRKGIFKLISKWN